MTLAYKYVLIDDTTYAYTINGDGEALVLLHGFTGTSKTWLPFIKKWKEHYQVITIDLPGHGNTTGESNLPMQEICHHIKQFLDHLSIEKCHLLGYSMGGRTALSFAMWYPLYIESLLLESASPGLPTEKERSDRVIKDTQLAKRINHDGITKFVDFWENIPLFNTQKKLPKHKRAQIRAERLSQSEAGLAASLVSIGTGVMPSWWETLHELQQHVCLIVGKEDEKFVQLNTEMDKRIEHCTFHIVPEAGHAVHIEQPEAFAKIVQQFIDKTY